MVLNRICLIEAAQSGPLTAGIGLNTTEKVVGEALAAAFTDHLTFEAVDRNTEETRRL